MLETKTVHALTNRTFTKALLDKTTFFQIAEGGAMGEPGGIWFLTEDNQIYHANYCFGDLTEKTISSAFPVIDQCSFGLFGFDSKVPDGWQYVNLGFGNHLLVRQDRYESFAPLITVYKSPGEVYEHWLEHAVAVN